MACAGIPGQERTNKIHMYLCPMLSNKAISIHNKQNLGNLVKIKLTFSQNFKLLGKLSDLQPT